MAVVACDEVRAKIAVSRTEDDLVVLSTLYAVLHQVAVDTYVTFSIFAISLRTNAHSSTAQ